MNPRTLYRAASIVLVLFFMGHTAGGMLAQKSLGPESDKVFAAMKSVHVNFNGADCTWYGFWFGLGLGTSLFLLVSAIVAWKLGSVAQQDWHVVSTIAWVLLAANVGNTVLAWAYFFAGPGVFATTASGLLGAGAWLRRRDNP